MKVKVKVKVKMKVRVKVKVKVKVKVEAKMKMHSTAAKPQPTETQIVNLNLGKIFSSAQPYFIIDQLTLKFLILQPAESLNVEHTLGEPFSSTKAGKRNCKKSNGF